MRAVFIMSFAKGIEWPPAYQKGNFVVGVVGNSPLYNELIKMAKIKKVANQSLEIKKYTAVDDIAKCHILYVSENKTKEIANVVSKVKPNSTLIITAEPGLAEKGSGINFIVKNYRTAYEINKKNVEKHKLKLRSNIEKLAFEVK